MQAALLLVDLQLDFLDRPGLQPSPEALIRQVSRLLEGCRSRGVPVVHAHSIYKVDGSDRMPHWKRDHYHACVEGSHGAGTPPALSPASGETIIVKKFFSAFGNPDLGVALDECGVDTLIVAGIYSHACVYAAVLDAYQHGLTVWVAGEAVGSIDSLQSNTSRYFLEGRAAAYLTTDEILNQLGMAADLPDSRVSAALLPVARIDGTWVEAGDRQCNERCNPVDYAEILCNVPIATQHDVEAAVECASRAAAVMAALPPHHRADILYRLCEELEKRRDEFVRMVCAETAKPIVDARGEFERAVDQVRAARRQLEAGAVDDIQLDPHTRIRYCPVGVVAAITPWNNSLAIPLGKLAPAIAFGNSVVWKPAMEAPRTAMALIECLESAGVSAGAVNLLFGDAATVHALISQEAVAAVTLTGSTHTGRLVASTCSALLKPLQAELGGNNAAIVMADCEPGPVARSIAALAFSYSGQRCTALRRIIVEVSIAREFTDAFVAAVSELRIGQPAQADTRIGPLISHQHQEQVAALVAAAVRGGAQLLCGGRVPAAWTRGCWFEPTVLQVDDCREHIFLHETFGPVAVIHQVADFDAAMLACNAVDHGLVAALFSDDARQQARFLAEAEVGILRINRVDGSIHTDAPFAGWKFSGFGRPEHGIWDRDFYTRPQAVYQ